MKDNVGVVVGAIVGVIILCIIEPIIIFGVGWFDVVSFDNLAIKQLNPQRIMSKETWDEMYMGDDGLDGEMTSASMYVDMVKREFARNSCAVDRYPIMDDIKDMFNFLRGRNGLD